ncbi:MAG: hypothetical protein FJ146_12060 [Deltaproteobacteria bacterium]|nr:hypothetical protein [Deltaproteobacteria bacterium]
MAKLYLIRRNLEGFSGPMTLMELKDAFKRMQFGLSDEVSGHCGPWVSMDNMEKVKKTYPEVARIVYEDLASDWGVSGHGEPQQLSENTRLIRKKSARGLGLAVTFLLLAAAAFVAAIYMANNARMSSKARELPDHAPRPEDAQSLLDSSDKDGFFKYMQTNMQFIVDKAQSGRKDGDAWLPYLRSYAFARDGQISGLRGNVLRGAAVAPLNCSYKTWAEQWRSSQASWHEVLTEHQLVHAQWARVLAWDPNWIRKKEHKGWLAGENYYLGCLVMAQKALVDLSEKNASEVARAEFERNGVTSLKSRLNWLIAASQGLSAPESNVSPSNELALWSCFEDASDLGALGRCRANQPRQVDTLSSYSTERYIWNILRLGVAMPSQITGDVKSQLVLYADSLGTEDKFTRFDYPAEVRFLTTLSGRDSQGSRAADRGSAESPHGKVAH